MTPSNPARDRIAFALDYPDLEAARDGATLVAPHVGVLKVGLELFIREGAVAVSMARSLGCDVFLDLKLHDIEKTVERAVGTAASLGARYLTIHTCGGAGMMEAAAKRAQTEGTGMKILGVTVLTSLGPSDLFALGIHETPTDYVKRLGTLARQSGLHGLVCSSAEVEQVRQTVGPDMMLVTPGIRPAGMDPGDQKRVGTPREAIANGSDLLVVGRPIRDAPDPARAARDLHAMVAEALE